MAAQIAGARKVANRVRLERSLERQKQVVELYDSGYERKEIAGIMELSYPGVSYLLRRADMEGLSARCRRERLARFTERTAQKASVVRLHHAGLWPYAIAARTELSIGLVRGLMKELGVRRGNDGSLARAGLSLKTSERRERALRLFHAGRSAKEVSAALGVSLSTVYLYRRVKQLLPFAKERRIKAARLFRAGQRPKLVAASLGVSLTTAYAYRKGTQGWTDSNVGIG